MNSIIKLRHINKIYNEGKENSVFALKDLSFEAVKGDMIAICGTSGAGKSTLLNIIGCVDSPTDGKYYLEGEDISGASPKALAKLRNAKFGYIFQEYALINNRTVFDNVLIPLVFSKKYKYDTASRVKETLERLGIAKLRKSMVNELSGGQRQRVAIARALINEPDIILADEPTGALDSKTGTDIIECLKEVNDTGKTVLIVTHSERIASYCKKRINIEDGVLSAI
ncbi:MAG: ABC transporter ATP-binding protein [Clostridiales bacterium]|jgi:ABC-type lipoprotein export system ATPase subunit|nr:ABC transporter ATP-binding protein [Clostridiales bacterium]